MRKIGIIHYLILMWMAYTNICTGQAYERLPRNPLEGSKERFPGINFFSYLNEDLTRLLDVGATIGGNDFTISYVPPLDGSSPDQTLWQKIYAMKFVLFDLQLVELKAVDPLGGSFRVELQMILHWIDNMYQGGDGTIYADDCTFICDTKSPNPLCCDGVWVPPLHLPGCEIHEIKSSTPIPYISKSSNLSYHNCLKQNARNTTCIWRRLWYLNIDATCENNMDFRNFPFDVQSLTIQILNPYASRTWFQLTKGFLQDNIDDGINNVNLSPDRKILGWYLKDLKVSSTCGTSESWKQTFLTQYRLLRKLINHSDGYEKQREEIDKALQSENLKCPNMEDFSNSSTSDKDFTSPASYEGIYNSVKHNYAERVNSTISEYKQCIKDHSNTFSWNMSVYKEDNAIIEIPEFGKFNTSKENIHRSFSILDLEEDHNVSFPCAIKAVANLTVPGIQVTILVQRYRKFYVMKLILPTVACVAFSFAAFGLHPRELMGRLTVVVPSAIALTALQSLVVATDIPPVAYIAPSTYIFIFSYLAQILISFESVLMKCIDSKQRKKCLSTMSRVGPMGAPIMHDASIGPYYRNREGLEMCAPTMHEGSSWMNIEVQNDQVGAQALPNSNNHMRATRKWDLVLMIALCMLYIMTIFICTILPWHREQNSTKSYDGYVSLWRDSTN